MSERIRRVRGRGEGGFTIVELLIYLVIAVVVIAAIYNLLIGQNRLYMKQRELQDVRSSLRATAAFLAWEFRQASAADGDLYSIDTTRVTIRSVQGTGTLCGFHSSGIRFGLQPSSGEFYATAEDSALIFAVGDEGIGDDAWLHFPIVQKWKTASVAGVNNCKWGDGTTVTPDLVIEVDTSTTTMTGVHIGAPVRAVRRVEYGLYQDAGRWWLGRKVGSAASYEKLTGPLRQPTDSGLVFTYYDQAGNVTADPTQVRIVDIILRGESFGKVPNQGGAPIFQQDTMSIRVSLRG